MSKTKQATPAQRRVLADLAGGSRLWFHVTRTPMASIRGLGVAYGSFAALDGKVTATVLTTLVIWAVLRIFLLAVGAEWMEWVYEQIVGVAIIWLMLMRIWR